MGLFNFKKKDFQELVDEANNLISPIEKGVYVNLSPTIARKSLKLIEKSFKLSPNNFYGLYTKGVILIQLNQFDEAKTCFDLCNKINKITSNDLISTGDFCYDISQKLIVAKRINLFQEWFRRAMFCYKLSLEYNPKNVALLKKINELI